MEYGMKNVKQQIMESLREEIPLDLISDVDEIELLLHQDRYREAYLKMYELQHNKGWSPTNKFLQLMEQFWWNYAN